MNQVSIDKIDELINAIELIAVLLGVSVMIMWVIGILMIFAIKQLTNAVNKE